MRFARYATLFVFVAATAAALLVPSGVAPSTSSLPASATAAATQEGAPISAAPAAEAVPAGAEVLGAKINGLLSLRLVNYYPATHGWGGTWTRWDPVGMDRDFGGIEEMGANGVRLIVQPRVFGYPVPRPAMLARLATAVSLASEHGLRVQLTLFDLFWPFRDLAGSRRWAAAVLGPFHGDRRVAWVEVQNEMDARVPAGMVWARAMIPYLKQTSGLPVGVSAAVYGAGDYPGFAALVKALASAHPDIFSFHYYADPHAAPALFARAKQLVGRAQLFIGETGYPTATTMRAGDDPVRVATQVRYFTLIERAAFRLGLPAAAPWTWSDFKPWTLAKDAPGVAYHQGLVRVDGSRKPSYWFFDRYYHWLATHQVAA